MAIGRAAVYYARLPMHLVQKLNVGTYGKSFTNELPDIERVCLCVSVRPHILKYENLENMYNHIPLRTY